MTTPGGLLGLQAAFQQHVLAAEVGGTMAARLAPARPRERAGGPPAADPFGPDERLAVYHRAYRARLVDALADTFAHTQRYLGSEWFEHDARAFIEATPSTHRSLNDYGRTLPAWWAAQRPGDAEIGELALLDWSLRRAFDGADAPVLTLADLAALPAEAWADVGFITHPTLKLLRFSHNTLALWTALDAEADEVPATAPLPAPGTVVVWRRGHSPHFRSIAADEADALHAVADGQSFAALCESLAQRLDADTATATAGGWLRRWTQEEMLSALRLPP